MARATRRPDMLRELFAALGNDPRAVAETLARPILVDRLIRSRYAADARMHAAVPDPSFDAWWASASTSFVPSDSRAEFDFVLPPVPDAAETCTPDTWTPGPGSAAPDPRTDFTAVWTGTEMIVWGGSIFSAPDTPTGGIYDPVTETWRPVQLAGAPSARHGHTAVWTGTRMIVWGGIDLATSAALGTGGIYDPAGPGSWTATPATNAPAARYAHTAVWSGSRMIVWGGTNGTTALGTGALLDPAAGWTPTPPGPPARQRHTAVWTGTRMIVWGGFFNGAVINNGASFDPSGAGSWAPVQTSGSPAARADHVAVWTGSKMIVWGGNDAKTSGTVNFNTGGVLDPAGTGSWTPTSMTNAPSARSLMTAVWTGTRMIVWGGNTGDSSGGVYDPTGSGVWSATQPVGAPTPRSRHASVWTGSRMLVWGGSTGAFDDSGGSYDPSGFGTWTPTGQSPGGPYVKRYDHTAVWTGAELILWGGHALDGISSGGRFDPATDSWSATSPAFAPLPRAKHSAVWTGTHMIIWGGEHSQFNAMLYDSGGMFDPTGAGSWSATPLSGVQARRDHSAVWTGSRMIVWGGSGLTELGGTVYLNSGGVLDPAAGNWTPTQEVGAPSARAFHTAVWTGDVMIVWGGWSPVTGQAIDGGRYTPAGAGAWSPTSASGAPEPRRWHSALWTGSAMIVWGGNDNTGGIYDPVGDVWSATSTTDAPPGRANHAAAWTGSKMIVWGGSVPEGHIDTGGLYDPSTGIWTPTPALDAPQSRDKPGVGWTGNAMWIAGGYHPTNSYGAYCACATPHAYFRDHDADGVGDVTNRIDSCSASPPAGYVTSSGDCDETNASVWAIPGEVDSLVFGPDKATVSWTAPPLPGGIAGSIRYDVVSSVFPEDFGAGGICVATDVTATTLQDPADPDPEVVFFYLVRSENACGSLGMGRNSAGSPRPDKPCP